MQIKHIIKDKQMKRVHIFTTEKQLIAIQAMAKDTGLSMAEIIRRAIDLLLEQKQIKSS